MKHKGCGGACCRRFVLQYSPEELRNEYEAWLRSSDKVEFQQTVMTGSRSRSNYERITLHGEIYLIYPMLIYLGYNDWEPNNPGIKIPGQRCHHYTCKHFDTKTNLCTIYEIRPLMCRNYPNGHACRYKGCKLPGNEAMKRSEDKQIVEGK